MPERLAGTSRSFDAAALAVERELRISLGFPPERLDEAELRRAYPTRKFARGWRIGTSFSDGEERRIDVLVSPAFPAGYPRTALVDRPEHMTWPHVERDGVLCLLPVMAEVDAERPGDVAVHLLARSARLVEEMLAGQIVDRDFREEFLTYWFYGRDDAGPRVVSTLRTEGPSRCVRAWRDGRGLVVVGEDNASLTRWLRNWRGDPPEKAFRTEAAALVWLPEPPIPSQYPNTGADLMEIAGSADAEAVPTLRAVAAELPDDLLVVLGAEGRGGPGLVAVTTTSARRSRSRTGRVRRPLTKGFRDGGVTVAVAAARTFSAAPVLRSDVARADAQWMHGRGRDPRAEALLASNVVVVGCGSIGSSVAARLARAGIGTLHLVDHDALAWSNLGRHELGSASVGLNKATELADRLSRDLPHLEVVGHPVGANTLLTYYPDLLERCDLIVVATGSWGADGAINRWHIASGRAVPVVYGWAESRAVAGHAVTVSSSEGCLRCGVGPTGVPAFAATEWPEGTVTLEEPACGNHFQPYGAVELGFVVDLVAEAALDALLAPRSGSGHAVWMAAGHRVASEGGRWTDDAVGLGAGDAAMATRHAWPAGPCPACSEARRRDAA